MQRVIAGFEGTASVNVLNTYVYDYLSHQPIRSHRTCDAPYSTLGADAICKEVLDFHDQAISLYRSLIGRAEIREAKELLETLLDLEEHEAMRLSRQTERMHDI
mgnify:FL=1